jgi:hypothetical protein
VRGLLVLGIAFAALSACEKAGDSRKTIEQPPPKVTVTLVDAGAEPRAPLRYHYKPDSAATFERTGTETDQRGDRTAHHQTDYMIVEARIAGVDADGRFHEHARIVDAGHRPHPGDQPLSDAERAWSTVRETEVDTSQDARGRSISQTLLLAPGTDPAQLAHVALEHTMVLPDEPVGVGARWHFELDTRLDYASVDATLIGAHGDQLDVHVTYDAFHRIPGQSLAAKGSADWHVDLAGPHTTMHARSHVVPDPAGDGSAEMIVDVAPVVR